MSGTITFLIAVYLVKRSMPFVLLTTCLWTVFRWDKNSNHSVLVNWMLGPG